MDYVKHNIISSDGSDLFSVALFGSEEKSTLPCLASVCHAVEHYELVCVSEMGMKPLN